MGNLPNDFWTYTYNNYPYFGICEVVKGDLQYRRIENKFENHITKALEYMMMPGNKFESHMSLQSYSQWLKGRVTREDREETYHPFTIEIEPHKDKKDKCFMSFYKDAVGEALRTISYMIYGLDIDERDILIMINNSRSIYIMVNPKAYGLKPSNNLHNIYLEMFKALDNELNFKYADKSMYKRYTLIKTPNCYYAGGYFVPVSYAELQSLYLKPEIKSKLTASKRSLDYIVPAKRSEALSQIYINAVEELNTTKTQSKRSTDSKGVIRFVQKNQRHCVKFLESNVIEKGCRNHALISVAIDFKEKGYTMDLTLEKLLELANLWRHDESSTQIEAKVKAVYRNDYKFSCNTAKELLDIDMDSVCQGCPYAQKCRVDKIAISKDIISDLWSNKASTRHYIAYLELSDKALFNKWFVPAEHGLNERTIRELCTYSSNLNRSKDNERIFIKNNTSGKVYYLPLEFMTNKVYELLGDYIKHYLKLIFMGFKSYERYIIMNVSKEKIQEELNYTSVQGVYKLLGRLQEIGLVVVNKGKVRAVYYESYKVIDIEEYKNKKAEKAAAAQINTTDVAVVNLGIQVNKTIDKSKDEQRGSPGSLDPPG